MTDRKQCTRCKVGILLTDFNLKRSGEYQKICNECNAKNRERYKCEICGKTYQNNGKLKRHVDSVHENIRNFACSECEWMFGSNEELQRHLWSKHDISSSDIYKYHQCDFCESKFKTLGELYKHLWLRHDISSSDAFKYHQCDFCESKFKTNHKLNVHMWSVHDISSSDSFKYHNCDSCGYKSKIPSDLRRHLTTCTGSNTSISGLEMRCMEALSELGFEQDTDYIYNKTFSELTDWCGKLLRPDIRFINHKIIIELDGSQHFKPTTFGSMSIEEAEQNFLITQHNDKLKNDFCNVYGYKMIRIPYTEITNILGILHNELEEILEF